MLIKCPITGRVFYNPVKSTNSECHHVFEEEVIREHLVRSSSCPSCSHEISELIPAADIKEQIAGLLASGEIQLFQIYFSPSLLRDVILLDKDPSSLQSLIFLHRLEMFAAYFYAKRAEKKFAADDLNGALKDCNNAFDNHPDCTLAYVLRAKLSLRTNKLNSAIQDATHVITKQSVEDHLLQTSFVVRARALLILGRVKGAMLDLNAASDLIKDDVSEKSLCDEIRALKMSYQMPNRLLAQTAPTVLQSSSTCSP